MICIMYAACSDPKEGVKPEGVLSSAVGLKASTQPGVAIDNS